MRLWPRQPETGQANDQDLGPQSPVVRFGVVMHEIEKAEGTVSSTTVDPDFPLIPVYDHIEADRRAVSTLRRVLEEEGGDPSTVPEWPQV